MSDRNITSGSVSVTIPNIGHLFQSPFGSAPKIGNKKIRTSIAYLYNNPVERNIHQEAIKWRWNFLAYAFSDHPFSEKLSRRVASTKMRKNLKEIEGCCSRGSYLRYPQLHRMFDGLSPEEKTNLSISLSLPIMLLNMTGSLPIMEVRKRCCLPSTPTPAVNMTSGRNGIIIRTPPTVR